MSRDTEDRKMAKKKESIPTDGQIEQVAKAMWDFQYEGDEAPQWDDLDDRDESLKREMRGRARAGIEKWLRIIKVSDLAPYVAAQVEQARREERERCIEMMVKPLMGTLLMVQEWLAHCPVSRYTMVGERHRDSREMESPTKAIEDALAAVRKAQEEQP